MRNKKMAAARAGLSSAMFAFFFPYKQYTLPFFFPSQNGAFGAERHYCHSKSSYTLYSPPFQPFQASYPGFSYFPVGERKDKEKFRNIKVA